MTKTTFLIILAVLLVFMVTKFLLLGYFFKLFKPKEMTDEEKQDEDEDFEDLT